MTAITVHHNDLVTSVRAAMIFPNDVEKGRIFVAWFLSQGPLRKLHTDGHQISPEWHLDVTKDAGEFWRVRDEVGKNEMQGAAVGEIIQSLWALICSHRAVASIGGAIEVVESLVAKNGPRSDRSTFREHLSALQPVLHLWGAWAIRRRKWIEDASQGYTARLDVRAFITEAEALREQLLLWNGARTNPSSLLQKDFLCPYAGWIPFENESLKTGFIPGLALMPGDVPDRKPLGRPKLRPG
jgi:hypothetical protein